MQETLTELNAADTARRQRALRYEELRHGWTQNVRAVERLEAQSPIDRHISNLERIIDAAGKLDTTVTHDGIGVLGGCSIPNGQTAPMITIIAQQALKNLAFQKARRADQLAVATKKRDEFKCALDEEFPESGH